MPSARRGPDSSFCVHSRHSRPRRSGTSSPVARRHAPSQLDGLRAGAGALPDLGDLAGDPGDVALVEGFAGREVEPGAAELVGDRETLAAELVEIDRLQVDGDE